MAGFGFGLGGFTQGLDNGIKEGTSLANALDQMQSRKDDLGLRQKADARAQQQFDIEQPVRQRAANNAAQQDAETQKERDLSTKAQSDYDDQVSSGQAQPGQFQDFYIKNTLPQVISNKIATGDPDQIAKAAALDNWAQSVKNKSLIENQGAMVGQAAHAQATGDVQPLSDTMGRIWNNLSPNLTGGSKFQGLQVSKSPSGDVQGVTGTFVGADGKTYQQSWKNLDDLVENTNYLSHPSVAFEYHHKAGLIDPLVTAATSGSSGQPQPTPPASASDDSAEFSSAKLASTPVPLVGGGQSTGLSGVSAPSATGNPPTASVSAPAAPPNAPAAITPDNTGAADAAPAPSSVQPTSASSMASAAPVASSDQTALNQAQPSGEMGEVFGSAAPPTPRVAPAVPAQPQQMLAAQPAAPVAAALPPQQQAPVAATSLDQVNAARQAQGLPPLTPDQAAHIVNTVSGSETSAPNGGGQSAAVPIPAAPLQPVAPAAPAPQAQQPNVTVVPTRTATPGATNTANAPQAQPQIPPVGLSPDVHDAVVRGLSSGDPEAKALATQVLTKYGKPEYEYRSLADGSLVAVNKTNPSDARVVFHAGASKGDGDDNVKLVAQAIQNGDQPPVLTGLYRNGMAVKAQLEKNGFNVANAQVEWTRAQKQIAALNGPQMTRFVGLASSVTNTIDEVNDLSSKMALGGIPALNRAELAAYVQADGNSENGQLATRYLTAVNTLKEEFANLAQGGYAPTESAWGLANQQINGNFGVKQLGASLNEVQRLVKYRVQAVPGLSTEGPGTPNRYFGTTAPSQAAPAATAPAATNGVPTQATKQAAPSPGHYSFNPASGKLELVQ